MRGFRIAACVLTVAIAAGPASAETLHLRVPNCYDAMDTWTEGSTFVPGQWVVQHIRFHVNGDIRNRCDPNDFPITGTWTTFGVWEGNGERARGGPVSNARGNWYEYTLGYTAPGSPGVHDMRAYIRSAISAWPAPWDYDAAARALITVVTPPSPPRNLRATPGPTSVRLDWDPPATDGARPILAYQVFRDGAPRPETGGLTYTDSPLAPGECHSYTVRARNDQGWSGLSNTVTGCALPDVTPPIVAPVRDREPNEYGWYNAPVVIDWVATDPPPSSGGPTDPPDTVADDEGFEMPYTSDPSYDGAGNSATGTDRISLDMTPPAVGYEVVPPPNEYGWHRGDVTVPWSCADALSGLVSECSSAVVGGEGDDLGATITATDRADNATTASAGPLRIDRTPPVTAHDVPAWSRGDVTVTLSATDALSGVLRTTYRLDGGGPVEGSTVDVRGHGTHTLEFWSVDLAGNVEPVRTVEVRIDAEAPTISHVLSSAPNAAGWHDAPVTVTWTCADDNLESCSDPVTVATDGVHELVGVARDLAGNETLDPVTVRLDRTAPSLDAVHAGPDGWNGWHVAPVDVTWDCADALSGVAAGSCPAPVRLDAEGMGLTTVATVADVAGNTTTGTAGPFKIDLADPAAAITAAPGSGAIVGRELSGTATDTMSGIARLDVRVVDRDGLEVQRGGAQTCVTCVEGQPGRDVGWTASVGPAVPRGVYFVEVRSQDFAGRWSPWSATARMLILA